METLDLTDWSEFSAAINHIRPGDTEIGSAAYPHYLFRGVARQSFTPQSSLERSSLSNAGVLSVREYLLRIEECRPQIESLTGREWPRVNEDAAGAFYEREGWYECYSYMTYLRHHGYPSPLLDWSASPYVAAYFAFDQERANVSDTEPVAVFAIEDPRGWMANESKPHLSALVSH